MRRIFALFIFILLISQLQASPTTIEEDILWFRSLGSRDDGSNGENEAFKRIVERFESLSISYKQSDLSQSDGGHSYSRNISTRIAGTIPGEIILAAPVDGGAYGLSLLLEMADYFQINPPRHSVTLFFLGAERGQSIYHPYGGRAASIEAEEMKDQGLAVVYIDADDIPSRWQVRPGGNGTIAPYWFIETFTEVLSEEYIPFDLRGTDIQLARLGLQGETDLMNPWLEKDIPIILLSGEGVASGTDRITLIKRFRDFVPILDSRFDIISANIRSSYVFLRPLADLPPRVIPELPFVLSFLGVSALLLMVILARYRDVSLNLRRFSSRLWALPLIAILVFLYFFLATLFVEETLLLADFPDLWKFAPGTFIFFKLSIAAALSLNFILITRGLPLPRSPHFYSYSAVVISGLASLVFMSADITLGSYSVITIFILLLFIASKNIRWKTFLLILSTVPYLMGLSVIIKEPYDVLISYMLLNRITGNIILSLVLLPQILALTSLTYWQLHYKRVRQNIITPAATLILSISAFITLAWILNINPFNATNPQPVELTDRINLNTGDRRLEVSSSAPIGNTTLVLEGNIYPLESLGRKAEVRTPLNRTPLKVEHRSINFLGRRTVSATVNGENDPKSLEITISSDSPFTVHDADFPFQQSADGTSARMFIGNHPQFPLNLSFTVNGDAQLYFNCVAFWDSPEEPPTISRTDLQEEAGRVTILSTQL